jgi:hypothetical protein
MNRLLVIMALTGVLLAGCQSKADANAAIHQALVKYMATKTGLNVNNMEITVTQANIHGDNADANVEIRVRNAGPNAPAMQLLYQLQKQGEEWVVVKGQATGGMQHPAPGETSQGELPPGHPGTDAGEGQGSADHPDFNAILNSAQPPNQQAPAQQPSGSQQQPQKP